MERWFYVLLWMRLIRLALPWIVGVMVAGVGLCLFPLPPLMALVAGAVVAGWIALNIERFLRGFSAGHDQDGHRYAPRRTDDRRRRRE